ncbi:MAG: class I SAM-dependent methyltransferase, partial [Candidatus Bathyarchaeia archaeon]
MHGRDCEAALRVTFRYYAPFIPTPPETISRMLEVGKVGRDDVLYDLGCGDGRILIAAVKQFGVKKAVGFEIRKDLYEAAVKEVEKHGMQDRVLIENKDFHEADLSKATIITLYLTGTANSDLKPKFEKECKPGTRIVSRVFIIDGWK